MLALLKYVFYYGKGNKDHSFGNGCLEEQLKK
jgi:hypothetical protein